MDLVAPCSMWDPRSSSICCAKHLHADASPFAGDDVGILPAQNEGVARRRPDLGVPQRTRPGVFEALVEGAGELVQSVVVEVVPPVVDAVDVDALVQRIDIEAILARIDLDALVQRVDMT